MVKTPKSAKDQNYVKVRNPEKITVSRISITARILILTKNQHPLEIFFNHSFQFFYYDYLYRPGHFSSRAK